MATHSARVDSAETTFPHISRGIQIIASLGQIYRYVALTSTRRSPSATPRSRLGTRDGHSFSDESGTSRVHSSTRELAFGGSVQQRREKIGFRRLAKHLWKRRCIQRTIFVCLIFALALGVYYVRFNEYILDERLRQEWLRKRSLQAIAENDTGLGK